MHTHRQQAAFSLVHTFGPFVSPGCAPLSLSLLVVVSESRVGIAFSFPQSLLSGSRRDSSLIVTAGGVLRIRGQRGVDEGRGLRAGVGERMRGVGRVQHKRGGGGEGVGEDARIEGGPMDEIGLAEKSPPETGGGELPI